MARDAATPARLPHTVMDLKSRRWKAEKIERLLEIDTRKTPIRILEVGTGSGGIAHYFGVHPSARYVVDAVDVIDNRLVDDGYSFTLVTDTSLPFADDCFDVVLSNHVIEHVGDERAQGRHLAEIRRVLRPGGVGYLAVPNRWMLVEPHFRLAFLSWLPRPWRTPYLRLARKGDFYDCEPLEMGKLEALLRQSGFRSANRSVDALRVTFEIERAGSVLTRWLRRIPDTLLRPFNRLIPTHIYTFTHAR